MLVVSNAASSDSGASGVRMIRTDGADAGDARKVVNATRIPAGFWSAVWLIGSLVALVFGGTLLV
jgi:hypothetical protein